ARTIGVRRLASCAGAVVLGALVNVYVVLAPIDSRAFTWGKPRSVDALVDFLRGADYRHNAGVTADGLIDHLAALWTDQASRGLLLVIVVGIAGHVVLGRRGLGRIVAPLVTLAAWIGVAANRIFVIGIPDYDGYAWTPAMLACAGVVGVARLADAGRPRTRLLGMAAAALVAVPTSLARPAPWARTRAADRALHDVSTMLLRDAPRRALLMVAADHVAAPLLWVHEAEGVRPDVVVLPVGLASSSWYWDHLMARHPDLRPFALVGPGARRGRIERMLRENPGLVPVTDQAASVAELGWDECTQDVGAVARLAPCDGARLGTIATATRDARRLARWADELGDGSPSTDEAIGQVAYARGVRAWRGGEQRIAFALFAVALRAQERRAFDGVRGEVTRAPRILASPAIPRTRPIFDHAASRAAMCAMTEMAGARAPSFCGE
ncbi:MAG: hypothetical protein IT379_03120, partial [Deltaproteobacteria bacterium]|nr:hypothetical protein [Deltaproteobacteria bacterium]